MTVTVPLAGIGAPAAGFWSVTWVSLQASFWVRLASPTTADANDFLYQWDSSRDYDAAPGLEKIKAALLAINSADDERNPPETGLMERELKRIKNAKLYLVPASADTRGHGTTASAKWWKYQLQELLRSAPRKAM